MTVSLRTLLSIRSVGVSTSLWTLAFCAALASGADARPAQPRRGFFVSIDGLNPTTLGAIAANGDLTAPRGFSWLLQNGAQAERAWPGVVTLTAASHISTITCTTPSKNGIVANGFLSGAQPVSGYDHPFSVEPLWQAAERQDLSVLAVAYVGADGLTEDRKATAGIAYPSSKEIGGLRQLLKWKWSEAPLATTWKGDVPADARETSFEIVLNPKTGEKRQVYALLSRYGGKAEVVLDDDRDLDDGVFGRLVEGDATNRYVDVLFAEVHADSVTPGRLRRAFARLMAVDEDGVAVYVSKASYNNAYPESLRQALDDAKLVWPDYGVSAEGITLTPLEYVETQSMIDDFLLRVTQFAQSRADYDVVLFYQPLIDTMGHKYQGRWKKPFDPDSTDEITRAYVEAFRIVDANLSTLFAAVKGQDVVALMGDHGMDEILKTVNLARSLPADHAETVRIVTSGSQVLLYPAKDDPETVRAADRIGSDLKAALAALEVDGAPVLGAAYRRGDFDEKAIHSAQRPEHHGYDMTKWHWGEALWVYNSATNYWLQYLPLDPNQFLAPAAAGMHGNSIDTPSMATTVLVKAPSVHHGKIPEMRLIDVVPTFSRLLGIEPPRDCEGRAVTLP